MAGLRERVRAKVGATTDAVSMALPTNLSDPTVLVTGSSAGIGRETADAFGREQARVAVVIVGLIIYSLGDLRAGESE